MEKKLRNVIKLVWLTALLVFIFASFSKSTYLAENNNTEEIQKNGRVLFLSSYSYGWDTVQIQIEGIKQGIGKNITLDYEFMDTKRVDDEESSRLFYEGFKYRMSKVEPYDVIIVGDDAALRFALKYREELFKDIPIIFEGVNDINLAETADDDPLITGILEKLSFKKNIEFALSIYPDANKVVAILDDTVTGQAERKSFYSNAEMYPELEFSEINTSVLSTEQLKEAIAAVEKNTILIYIVMTEDADGKKYTSYESIKLVYDNAKVPAFRMVSGGIGDGLLGGNIVSMEQSGRIAAQMAVQIINGKNPEEFRTIVDSPNLYCVDEDIMRKFDIDLSLIPEGAEIINHKQGLMEKYQEVLIPLTIIISLLVIIIIIIVVDNVKKRKLTKELEKTKSYLEYNNHHDSLTGIRNRAKFNEDVPVMLTREKRFALMMMDIDNFKGINDTYGHSTGDKVLREVAARLDSLSSKRIIPYRFAGDEFIVIVKSSDREVVEKYAKECMNVFEAPFVFDNDSMSVKVSIGIAITESGDTMNSLIANADSAMYNIKRKGKNDYAFYEKAIDIK